MCDCIKRVEKELSKQLKDPSIDGELLTGKTWSIVYYTDVVRGKEKRKEIKLTHAYCPWCGEAWKEAGE